MVIFNWIRVSGSKVITSSYMFTFPILFSGTLKLLRLYGSSSLGANDSYGDYIFGDIRVGTRDGLGVYVSISTHISQHIQCIYVKTPNSGHNGNFSYFT